MQKTAPGVAMAVAATTGALCAVTPQRRREEGDRGFTWKAAVNRRHGMVMIPSHRILCEEAPKNEASADDDTPTIERDESGEKAKMHRNKKHGFQTDAEGDYHGMFPARQLWKPAVEYPLW